MAREYLYNMHTYRCTVYGRTLYTSVLYVCIYYMCLLAVSPRASLFESSWYFSFYGSRGMVKSRQTLRAERRYTAAPMSLSSRRRAIPPVAPASKTYLCDLGAKNLGGGAADFFSLFRCFDYRWNLTFCSFRPIPFKHDSKTFSYYT